MQIVYYILGTIRPLLRFAPKTHIRWGYLFPRHPLLSLVSHDMSATDEPRAELLRESLGRAVTAFWEDVYTEPAAFFPELLASYRSKGDKDAILSRIRKHMGTISEACVSDILVRRNNYSRLVLNNF